MGSLHSLHQLRSEAPETTGTALQPLKQLRQPNQNQIISFFSPPLPSPPPPHHHHYLFGPERNNYFWSVEETWGSRAAAAATAAALHCFKVLLLDIRAGGESKENRSYSLLEPAVAFHTDDSSIFLSSLFFCFFSRCGKDGWQKRRRKDFSVRGLCQVDAEPRSTGGCLFGL